MSHTAARESLIIDSSSIFIRKAFTVIIENVCKNISHIPISSQKAESVLPMCALNKVGGTDDRVLNEVESLQNKISNKLHIQSFGRDATPLRTLRMIKRLIQVETIEIELKLNLPGSIFNNDMIFSAVLEAIALEAKIHNNSNISIAH